MANDGNPELTLVAAEAARADAGAVVGKPVVMDRSTERMYLLRRVDQDPPALTMPVSAAELDEMLQSRGWIRVPEWKARPGFKTLVVSEPFWVLLNRYPETASTLNRFLWPRDFAGFHITYAPRKQLESWMIQVADALLVQVEKAMFQPNPDLTALRSELAQVIFLTDRGEADLRLRMYLDFVLLDWETLEGDISPGVLSALRREFRHLEVGEIQARAERHRDRLREKYRIFDRLDRSASRQSARVLQCA